MPGGSHLTDTFVMSAIINHYWMREIGLETPALWLYHLNVRLDEILPKYVEIAKAQDAMTVIFDDLEEVEEWDVDGTKSEETSKRESAEAGSNIVDDKTHKLVRHMTQQVDTDTDTSGTSKEDGSYGNTKDSNSDDSFVENGNSSENNSLEKLFSDTPQNTLEDVKNGRYLTNAGFDTATKGVTYHSDSSRDISGHEQDNGTDTRNITSSSATTGMEKTEANQDDNDTDKTTRTTNQNSSGEASGTMSGSNAETGRRTRSKTSGRQYDIIYDYANKYVNIIQMIIGDVADLFMSII